MRGELRTSHQKYIVSLCAQFGWMPFLSANAKVIRIPFAQTALFASELPDAKGCDMGPGPNCRNPYNTVRIWRYAVNNLRRAVDLLPEDQRRRHKSTVSAVARLSNDIDMFYQQPTAETLVTAAANCRQVFNMLKEWMTSAPLFDMEVSDDASAGVKFVPGGQSLRIVADNGTAPGEAKVRLANGVEMPVLGFGTWQLQGSRCYEATLQALHTGYRHVDTAQAYGNELEVGRAIADAGVPRRQLFVATKLSDPADFEPSKAHKRFMAQLQELRLDYVDMYMLHSPGPNSESTKSAWAALEDLYYAGRTRALGVSNFGIRELEDLLSTSRVPPVYVQNKFSVYSPGHSGVDTQSSIMGYLQTKHIVMMGYSVINPWPSGVPPMQDPHVLAIAQRYARTPSQVLHRWVLQLGAGVIPKSAHAKRIRENARIFDFMLSDFDVRLLNGLVTLMDSSTGGHSPTWVDDVYGLGVGVRGVSN